MEETALVMQKDVETEICEFFETNPKEFYSDGINKLVNRWKEVINNLGKQNYDYI